MDRSIKLAIKNFKFVFSAQLIVLLFGLVKAIFIPTLMSVEGFGYWQIYLFYSSYVGIFMLGFNDGIYLRYGKYQYKDLPYEKLRSSIRIFTSVLIVFTLTFIVISSFNGIEQKRFSLICAAFNILILGLNGVFIYILQITNQMKYYSFYSVLDKVIFMLMLLLFTVLDINKLEYIIALDLISKCIVVTGMMFQCKDLWIGKDCSKSLAYDEYRKNVSVGIKLMLAQFMGMLVTGIGRILVEFFGNIEEYAYYSLGITITNLVLVLITAISMLIYPTLKRLPEENYPNYYNKINHILQKFIILIPFIFIVTYIMLPIVLPKYAPVLEYLNILFGVIMLQTKMLLLNNNFYNALRKESAMLKANMSTVMMFILLSTPCFYITKSIWSIALCTFIIMLWRCYASEVYLRKQMTLRIEKSFFLEIILIVAFVGSTSIVNINIITLLYMLMCLFILCLNWDKVKSLIKKNCRKNNSV